MAAFLIYMFSPILVAFVIHSYTGEKTNANDRIKKYFLTINGIIMTAMIGLRYYGNGSGDSGFYYRQWERFSQMPLNSIRNVIFNIDMEKGYLTVAFLLSHILKNPQFIFILSGVLFSISICRFIYKNCNDPLLGLMVFNCLGLFSFMVQGLRQSIAICICLLAIEKCKKRQLLRFLILVAIAMLFHGSAVVFILVYFIYPLKVNVKGIVIFSVAGTIAFLLLPYLFSFVNYYIDDNYAMINPLDDGSGIITILIYATIFLAGIILHSNKSSHEYDFFLYLSCITLVALIMRSTINAVAERISMYYICGQMVIVSDCGKNMEKKSRIIFTAVIILLCFGVAVHKSTYSPIVPYRFFWYI